MKHLKPIALLCALLMLSAAFVGCGNKNAVTVNVTVSALVEDEVFLAPVQIAVGGTTDNPPSVLDAAIAAFDQSGITSEANEFSILSIGEYADKEDGDYTCFWEYTVNGEKPTKGRANDIAVGENDIIVFTYVRILTSELLDEAED